MKGDLDEATLHCVHSVRLARELTTHGEEGSSLRILGEIATLRSDFGQAEHYLGESLRILDEVGYEYEAGCTSLSLAKTYLAESKTEECRQALERSTAIFQRLEARIDLIAVRELQAKLASIRETGPLVNYGTSNPTPTL